MATAPRPHLSFSQGKLTLTCPDCGRTEKFPCSDEQYQDMISTDSLCRSILPGIPEPMMQMFYDGKCSICHDLDQTALPPEALRHMRLALGRITDDFPRMNNADDVKHFLLNHSHDPDMELLRKRIQTVITAVGHGKYIKRPVVSP